MFKLKTTRAWVAGAISMVALTMVLSAAAGWQAAAEDAQDAQSTRSLPDVVGGQVRPVEVTHASLGGSRTR